MNKARSLLAILLLCGLQSQLLLMAPAKEITGRAKTSQTMEKKPSKDEKGVKPKSTPEPLKIDTSKISPTTLAELDRLSEAMHEEDRGIYNELRDDEELSFKDIGMLWQAAVERSGTIRYAIEKLSRRDSTGKPVSSDSMTRRVLQSLTRVGGVAGSMWTGNPAGMLGGSMVNDLLQGDPGDPSQARVSDADMLILAKEVESLQSHLIEAYYAYRHAHERWELTKEANHSLEKYAQHALGSPAMTPEGIALQATLESFSQSSQQEEDSAKQAFIGARNSLGLLVGEEALIALEKAQQVGQVSN